MFLFFSPIHRINCLLLFRVWYDVKMSVIFHTVWGHYKAPYGESSSIHHSISQISVTVAAKLP